ncbi:MAG: DUF1302 family protein [Rhizomicrobium sp.]
MSAAALAGFVVLLLVLPGQSPACAADVAELDGWDIRWDNTVRYTAAVRLFGQNASLISNANADDGDRNFSAGLISNRFDIVSELDVSDGNFGFDASAAAWYDSVYHQTNHNNSSATFNPYSTAHNEFTSATQRLDGEDIDLLNAFIHGTFDVGNMPVSFRIGRHSLLWGESLFFADNGIAAGQAPIDAIKAASEPDAEAKEVFLPVAQASITVQPTPNTAISAYYQFEWRRTRLPGSGSYFSDADYLDAGGERIIVGPGEYLYRGPDQMPGSSGQFGLAATATLAGIDFGLYAIRFNAKEPELFLLPGSGWYAPGSVGTYELAFPGGIDAYGASFSTYVGESTIAGEASVRLNMPLVSATDYALAGEGGGSGYAYVPQNARHPGASLPLGTVNSYAAGETLHGQLSSVSTFSPSKIWDGADFSVEFAANDLLATTENPYDLYPGRTRFAAAMRAVFEPKYFEVAPGLDVSLPVGLGYDLVGRSSIDSSLNAGAGDTEIGLSVTYRTVWQGSLTVTHYLGSADRQPFADRDFVSLSLERTF